MKIETIILEGKDVRLEPLRIEHLENLCKVGFEESIWRWTTMQIKTNSDMQRYLETALDEQNRGVSLPFVTIENLLIKLSARPVSGILTGKTGASKSAGRGLIQTGSERLSTRKRNF